MIPRKCRLMPVTFTGRCISEGRRNKERTGRQIDLVENNTMLTGAGFVVVHHPSFTFLPANAIGESHARSTKYFKDASIL